MLSFNALKMKTKLMLIVAIPLLGLLYCTISSTLEKAATAREMEKLASLVDVSVKIGTLVHELQKERGMTASFLGSDGVNFAKETLNKSRFQTPLTFIFPWALIF